MCFELNLKNTVNVKPSSGAKQSNGVEKERSNYSARSKRTCWATVRFFKYPGFRQLLLITGGRLTGIAVFENR